MPLAKTLVLAALASLFHMGPPPRPHEVEAQSFEVVDLHTDLPYWVHFKSHPIGAPGQMSPSAMANGRVGGSTLVLYLPDDLNPDGPHVSDMQGLFRTVQRIRQSPRYRFRTARDAPGHVDGYLSIEGAAALAKNPTGIKTWVKRGVKLVGMIHFHDNPLGGSATGNAQGGLSEAGKTMGRAVYEAGGVLDVSHASDRAFEDMLAIAKAQKRPLVATHSNCRSLAKHPRNLTDAQLRAIASTGGVVGINFYIGYLAIGRRAHVSDIVAHIEHAWRVAGEDHVAIGADYDGSIPMPRPLATMAGYPTLAQALLERGHSPIRIQKLFSANARRVLGPPPSLSEGGDGP